MLEVFTYKHRCDPWGRGSRRLEGAVPAGAQPHQQSSPPTRPPARGAPGPPGCGKRRTSVQQALPAGRCGRRRGWHGRQLQGRVAARFSASCVPRPPRPAIPQPSVPSLSAATQPPCPEREPRVCRARVSQQQPAVFAAPAPPPHARPPAGAKGTMGDKSKGDKKKPTSRSARAGLQFPVGRIHRLLKVRAAPLHSPTHQQRLGWVSVARGGRLGRCQSADPPPGGPRRPQHPASACRAGHARIGGAAGRVRRLRPSPAPRNNAPADDGSARTSLQSRVTANGRVGATAAVYTAAILGKSTAGAVDI